MAQQIRSRSTHSRIILSCSHAPPPSSTTPPTTALTSTPTTPAPCPASDLQHLLHNLYVFPSLQLPLTNYETSTFYRSKYCGVPKFTNMWYGDCHLDLELFFFFCELCLLQRKEDNQAVIFVICPHNWAFMEACYQLSLGLQVDFSMEWRLLQWHSLTRDKENADPDYYHILYLAIML